MLQHLYPRSPPFRWLVTGTFDSITGVKKAKSANSSLRAKRRHAPETVAAYLARVPEPARSTLNKIRAAIRAAVPAEATEVISYGIPGFKHKQVLVWYAAFSKHCSFFPTAEIIEAFNAELKGYPLSKGTIQFPTDRPLPAALVKRMVQARLANIEKKKAR